MRGSKKTDGQALLALAGVAVVVLACLVFALGWVARSSGEVADAAGVDAKTQTITLALLHEPPQLDSTRTTDSMSMFVIGHIQEGLLGYDEHGLITGGVAKDWDIRTDGATFHLRPEARWSDGGPVTAHDFVFAWQLAVDPKNAGQYAFLFYSIRNAEQINTGKLPPSALGVRAVDDLTLEVEFAKPVSYFDKLAAFVAYYPIREDFYRSRNGHYAADAEDTLSNGPFILTRWVHAAHIRLEKNPNYWDAGRVHLHVIDMPYMTPDGTVHVNLFRDKAVAMAGNNPGLGTETIRQAMNAGWPLYRANDGSVWYVEFNHRPERATHNRALRRAFQLSLDNADFVYRAMRNPGYSPAKSLFPSWTKGTDGLFWQEHPPREVVQDIPEARRQLAQAIEELGLDGPPRISLLTQDTASATRHAEYLQGLFLRTLGFEVTVDTQIFKQAIAKLEAGDFDLAIYGWGPDYDDPMTFGDLFASWNPNNHGRYANPEVDRQVALAQEATDPATRMAAFGRIQDLLLEDAALLPIYERGTLYVQDPRLKGVVRRSVGTDPDFKFAYVSEQNSR